MENIQKLYWQDRVADLGLVIWAVVIAIWAIFTFAGAKGQYPGQTPGASGKRSTETPCVIIAPTPYLYPPTMRSYMPKTLLTGPPLKYCEYRKAGLKDGCRKNETRAIA